MTDQPSILLIEDESRLRRNLQILLQREGYWAVATHDGAEGTHSSVLRHRLLPLLDLDHAFRLTEGQVWSTDTPADSCLPGLHVEAPTCAPLVTLTPVLRGHPWSAYAANRRTAKGHAFVRHAAAPWRASVRSVGISHGRVPAFAISVVHR